LRNQTQAIKFNEEIILTTGLKLDLLKKMFITMLLGKSYYIWIKSAQTQIQSLWNLIQAADESDTSISTKSDSCV
jgi:hypothetical protein